ncbi:MAG: bifunctional precorrin-2 dehydrogenase/sirohydrochlorin ferrochelatase [Sedimentisphaerales bacterium]|jgi:precorrin-2 dehydrogenase/sirohydrochlorin ferrochelatase
MAKYPIFLDLNGRRVVIIGGGSVATRKAEMILCSGARLVVVAPRLDETLRGVCTGSKAELIESKYSKDYLAGATIVIAATNDEALNRQIYKDCQQLEILCNVVDSPGLCDFYVPAVVQRGDLQIAIGTGGKSPAYAGHLRKKLENIFTDKHGEFLAQLEAIRGFIIEKSADASERKAILGKLAGDESFEYFLHNGPEQWRKRAEEQIIFHISNK